MSQPIQIRNDIYEKLKAMKQEKQSFSDILDNLLDVPELIEATINQEGRISKTLAGKTILYKIKE